MKAGWMRDQKRLQKAGEEAPDPPSWTKWKADYDGNPDVTPSNAAEIRSLAPSRRTSREARVAANAGLAAAREWSQSP